MPIPMVRLPQGAWDVMARVAWATGWSGGGESRRQAAIRAAEAAAAIERRLTQADGAIVVVAHGCMNILLAWELRARGFRGPRLPSLAHGENSTYLR
jgi:broad specificity phosphatase PhoE